MIERNEEAPKLPEGEAGLSCAEDLGGFAARLRVLANRGIIQSANPILNHIDRILAQDSQKK